MTNSKDSFEELSGEIKALRNDFMSLLSSMRDVGVEAANGAADSAKHAAQHSAESLSRAAHRAGRQVRGASDELEHLVAERPLTSVLSALGIGLLIGAAAQIFLRR